MFEGAKGRAAGSTRSSGGGRIEWQILLSAARATWWAWELGRLRTGQSHLFFHGCGELRLLRRPHGPERTSRRHPTTATDTNTGGGIDKSAGASPCTPRRSNSRPP